MNYEYYIRVVLDFPKKGISFKDISPLLKDSVAFHSAICDLAKLAEEFKPDIICGPESRAFIFGSALAFHMNKGFVMARKSGKLPGVTCQTTYQLEYGTATIAIPQDSFKKGERLLLVDDLMATGGTFKALEDLVKQAGGNPVGAVTLINLKEFEDSCVFKLKCKSLLDL